MAIDAINPDGTHLRTLIPHLGSASGLVPIPAPPQSATPTPSQSATVAPRSAATSKVSPHHTSRTGPITVAVVLVALAGLGSGYALLRAQ